MGCISSKESTLQDPLGALAPEPANALIKAAPGEPAASSPSPAAGLAVANAKQQTSAQGASPHSPAAQHTCAADNGYKPPGMAGNKPAAGPPHGVAEPGASDGTPVTHLPRTPPAASADASLAGNTQAAAPTAGLQAATAPVPQQQQAAGSSGAATTLPPTTTAAAAGAAAAAAAGVATAAGGSRTSSMTDPGPSLMRSSPSAASATSSGGASPTAAAAAAPGVPPFVRSAASAPQTSLMTQRFSQPGTRSVKFAEPDGRSQTAEFNAANKPPKRSLPRRSQSQYNTRLSSNEAEKTEAVLAKQVDILRSNKMGKLRQRRGGLDSSFAAMQDALATTEKALVHVNTRAAGLKHIGFGPFKRENQDEFFIQVGEFGGLPSSNLFCVFDGHGTFGKDAALYSRQLLPRLLDVELRKYFQRVQQDTDEGLKGAVEVLLIEVFGDTERSLAKSGVNLANSGTTASVAYQRGNRLWVASAGDSRAILCSKNARDQWRALPLTIDHRPRRNSERERIEAAGARVAPKRLPSGRSVGEPRLWLQNAGGPGLLLSRSLGDLTAATVGCTSDPEVSYTTLRPNIDHVLVMATDGVWDVLTNEQVCDIVVESPDPHIACRRVLDAALYEWEERMSADNITVLVVEFEWGEDGSTASVASLDRTTSGRMEDEVDATVMPTAAAPQQQPQQL